MARAPMKLHVKKNQLHKDVGKAPGTKITEADIAKENMSPISRDKFLLFTES